MKKVLSVCLTLMVILGCFAGTAVTASAASSSPAQVQIASTTSSQKQVSLTWKKASNADGYEVQQYKNSKWVAIKTVNSKTTSLTVKSLTPGTNYSFRVRAYESSWSWGKFRNVKTYSAWSKTITIPTTPQKTSVIKANGNLYSLRGKYVGKVILSWKSVKCDGYEVQVSSRKNFSGCQTAYVTGTSKTFTNLPNNSAMYVRVRAYKNYTAPNGTKGKIYSDWSCNSSSLTVVWMK